jgi:uncharacterized protein (TIGR02172 family)
MEATDLPPMAGLNSKAILGRGGTSIVYAWDEGRAVKLFHRGVARGKAEQEYQESRAIHSAGLPTPAAHELVEIDGQFGILFDRVDGVSMFRQVQARPWTFLAAVRQLAELHAQIHAHAAPTELPSQRDWISNTIDMTQHLSEAERQQARRCLSELPDGDTLCHGDFHPDNIFMTSRGPVIIDWDCATRGNPVGDVAVTVRLMRTANLPPWSGWHAHLLLKVSRPLIQRTYLSRYFQLRQSSRDEVDAWQVPLAALERAWQVAKS